jgi:putative ABC transport system substrate-binding protein
MELVRMKVDVIVTTGGISTRAAQKATTTIPIIFTSSGDPIEGGFIDSLARPGKNLTGVTFLAYELVGKRLELLKEAVPSVSRVAVIVNPAHPGEQRELSETQSIARALGLTLDHHPVRSKTDYEAAFDAISKKRPTVSLCFPRPQLWRMLRGSRSWWPSNGFRACSVGRSMSRPEVLWPMDRTGMKLTGESPFMSTRS